MAYREQGSSPVQVRDYGNLIGQLQGIKGATEKAVKNTVNDVKRRAPGWIAGCVVGVYNIRKSEITPSSSKSVKSKKMAGSIKVNGEVIENVTIVYTGRLLTPTHFAMRPSARPRATPATEGKRARQAKAYTVTAEIKKGSRKALGGGVFLGSSNGSPDIPFQRMGKSRTPLQVIKTLSMPQMITNEDVAPKISAKLTEGLSERLQHNVKRQLNASG